MTYTCSVHQSNASQSVFPMICVQHFFSWRKKVHMASINNTTVQHPAVAKLRALLADKDKIIVCPGVYDGFTARIALREGFDCLYMVRWQVHTYSSALTDEFSADRRRNHNVTPRNARSGRGHAERHARQRRHDRRTGSVGAADCGCGHGVWR